MANTALSLTGVKRRKSSGKYYYECRCDGLHSGEKFYCTKIKSLEEGALCYDITQLYIESEVGGKKRKAAEKLNYTEYSRSLQLESLPSGFSQFHKEEAMEFILKQAQAAVKNLPDSLRCSTPVVGSPCPSNGKLSHQNVRGKPLVAKQVLPGFCKNQLNLQEISELSHYCNMSYTSKVYEREMLERKVADINEASGIIRVRKPRPNKFTHFMARFKQLMTIDERIPETLEIAEQGYKSQDSECLKLRKLLEDHNFKVIGSLMDDGNETSGRQRANEDERLPQVLEDCPFEEQNECGVSVLDGEGCGPPGFSLVDVWPFGIDTTTLPAEMGVPQRVVPHEFDKVANENVATCETFSVDFPVHIGFRREGENGSLPEVWNGSNPEMPIFQWSLDDWIDSLYQEDPDWLISPPVIGANSVMKIQTG